MAGKRGRPSLETPENKQAILERISNGEPLAQICRDAKMPSMAAVNNWRRNDAAFDGDFARARESGHDLIAARCREVARGLGESSGDVQRDRLIVETDLKLLAKWDKRYSDKLIVDSTSTVKHTYDAATLDRLAESELDALERVVAKLAGDTGGESEAVASSVH